MEQKTNMSQEQYNELLLHLLVSTLSEIQITRDMTFAILSKQIEATDTQTDNAMRGIGKKIMNRKKAILAQIKLHYQDGFGSIDDLLNSIL